MAGNAAFRYTSATCVHYKDGDSLGRVLAYAALLPFLAVFFSATIAYNRRHMHLILVFVGFVFNEVVARGLKHYLRHPRPEDICDILDSCHSFGMPSSHTACMAFACGIHMLLMARTWPALSLEARRWALLEGCALAALTACVAWSRVYLMYHSTAQVTVAVCVGLVTAFAWYTTMRVLSPLVGKITETRIGRALMLTDDWTRPLRKHHEHGHQE